MLWLAIYILKPRLLGLFLKLILVDHYLLNHFSISILLFSSQRIFLLLLSLLSQIHVAILLLFYVLVSRPVTFLNLGLSHNSLFFSFSNKFSLFCFSYIAFYIHMLHRLYFFLGFELLLPKL